MAAKTPTTVEQYLDALTPERREALEALRAVINKNIDPKFEEGIQYGMPAWYLPHLEYPAGYHCDPKQPLPFASIASQKNHIGIYMMCIYGTPDDERKFREDWLKSGKKLDMGKACVRIKRLEQAHLPAIGRAIKRATAKKYVKHYETMLRDGSKRKAEARSKTKAKPKAKAKTKTKAKAKRKTKARAKR